jgi:RNA polymerase sigma-70 factor (ECF subfamily)
MIKNIDISSQAVITGSRDPKVGASLREIERAFEEAYHQYSDAIFRFCLFKVSDREIAKDLTQETFTKTWKYMVNGGCVENFKAFLYHAAGNIVIDQYRKTTGESLDTLQEKGFEPAFDDTDRMIDKMDGEQMLTLVKALPKEYCEVIFMKYSDNLTNKEIAEILGELEGTVRVRLHRGLKKLQEIMEEQREKCL